MKSKSSFPAARHLLSVAPSSAHQAPQDRLLSFFKEAEPPIVLPLFTRSLSIDACEGRLCCHCLNNKQGHCGDRRAQVVTSAATKHHHLQFPEQPTPSHAATVTSSFPLTCCHSAVYKSSFHQTPTSTSTFSTESSNLTFFRALVLPIRLCWTQSTQFKHLNTHPVICRVSQT